MDQQGRRAGEGPPNFRPACNRATMQRAFEEEKGAGPGTGPQGHGGAPGPKSGPRGDACPRGCPQAGAGGPARGRVPRDWVTASGGTSGTGTALTWAARRRQAVASLVSTAAAAVAAMLAGPSHRRRQMFPSNAPARHAQAQAHCVCRASVRSGFKGHGGGASAARRGKMAVSVAGAGEGRRGPRGRPRSPPHALCFPRRTKRRRRRRASWTCPSTSTRRSG